MHVKINVKISTLKGYVDVTGKIENLRINFLFREIDTKNPRPFIEIGKCDFKYKSKHWKIKTHIKKIPNFILNKLIKIF